jgi:putative transposase
LIHHSDRGSQYASKALRQLLNTNGFLGSMSRLGDCWDNAEVESFFGSLKQEPAQWCYQTRNEAEQDALNYLSMVYNRYRLHSYLAYISLNGFENQLGNMKNMASLRCLK